jgi:hypothetical protein
MLRQLLGALAKTRCLEQALHFGTQAGRIHVCGQDHHAGTLLREAGGEDFLFVGLRHREHRHALSCALAQTAAGAVCDERGGALQ